MGDSTRRLAERYPAHQVLGVDQSIDRLTRSRGALPGNALLLRGDLVDSVREVTTGRALTIATGLVYGVVILGAAVTISCKCPGMCCCVTQPVCSHTGTAKAATRRCSIARLFRANQPGKQG